MPLPAPPQTDDTGNVQSPENAVPSVRRTVTEKVLGGIGRAADMFTDTPATEFGQSMVGKLLDEHYQQRLNDARRHYVNKQAYAEILHTGVGPDGKDLSDDDRADYERRLQGATQDFAKAAGVNKDIKAQIEQQDDAHKTIYDATRTHGTSAVHGVLSRLGIIPQDKGAGATTPASASSTAPGAPAPAAPVSGPPPPPDANGVPTPAMGQPATSESLGVGKTGIPTPPPYDVADLAPMAEGHARSVVGQTATGLGAREQIAQAIGLAPKPGEQPSVEYQRFISTGAMPASTTLQLMGDRVPGKNVPANAVTLDGAPIDPSGFYRLQREPYSGTVIATAASLTAGQARPTIIKYKGPNGEDLFGHAVSLAPGKLQLEDQQGNPLPPGTEAFDASLAPTSSSTTAPHYTVDKDGNTIVNMGTSVTSRTRGLPPPPANAEAPTPAASPAAGGSAGAPSATPAPSAPAGGAAVKSPAAAKPAAKAGVSAAQPLLDAKGNPVHKQLSQPARNVIRNTTSALDMLDQIAPTLGDVVDSMGKDANSLWSAAQQRSAWQQYQKLGLDPSEVTPDSVVAALPGVDPRLAKLMPAIAMYRIVAAMPWLQNRSRFEYVQQVQQHVPNPEEDTPANMLSKLDMQADNLPNLIRGANESEGVEFAPFKYASVAEVRKHAEETGKSYADLAHALRQGGYKITRSGK